MRIYLTLFLFGSVMLTGCADDLVGPAVDAAGITDPVTMRDAAPVSFFKTWEAPAAQDGYRMTFRNTERSNQPAGADDARLALAGNGTYAPEQAADGSAERVSFTIVGTVALDREVAFTIVDEQGEVMAEAKGLADEQYERLELNIQFANGSERHVVLSPETDRTPMLSVSVE